MSKYNKHLEVIQERYRTASEYINHNISIYEFSEEKGLRLNKNGQSSCCPFHDDSRPSFVLDGTENIWKCFGCPDGGSFVQFFIRYAEKYEEKLYTKPAAVEAILQANPQVAGDLGFTTIYRSLEDNIDFADQSSTSFFQFEQVNRIKPKRVQTTSFKHALDKVKLADVKTKMAFISDCQQGLSEELLIKKYYYNDTTNSSIITFSETDAEISKALLDIFEQED